MTEEQIRREKQRIARQIRSLQNSRDYADEVESARLTRLIDQKREEYRQLEAERLNYETVGPNSTPDMATVWVASGYAAEK